MTLEGFETVMIKTWAPLETHEDRVNHALMTIITEAAEVVDIFKKSRYSPRHDGYLDQQHLREEIGDVVYGLVALTEEFGWTLEECMQATADKLMARYPEKF
jgi:NTP pyrophosphatase (non-canonical NTP hydrolase)